MSSLDLDALHELLWDLADSQHRYRFRLEEFAATSGLSKCNLSVRIGEFARERTPENPNGGRLKRIAGTRYGPKTYLVQDPATREIEVR